MDEAVGITQRRKEGLRPTRAEWIAAIIILALLTALTRASAFGNPIYQTDDQFYLHVGAAMLDGQLPYVDIWDRKPFGLFLIYAAIAALGGSGIEQYQTIAGIFVFLTALVIWRFGKRIASNLGGLAGAAAYLVTLSVFGGAGGQAPLFYNPLVGLAAYLTYDWLTADGQRIKHGDYLAMLLAGLALTIKTSCVVEGVFLGICLAVHAWKTHPSPVSALTYAVKLMAIAIAPTAACLLFYAAIGHADDFIFANFISIFLKDNVGSRWSFVGIKSLLIYLGPMLVAFLAGVLLSPKKDVSGSAKLFVGIWGLMAFIGALIVPNLYNHYFLPLFVPLAVGSAIAMRTLPTAIVFLSVISWASWMNGNIRDVKTRETKMQMAGLTNSIKRELGPGDRLFIFDGPVALYRTVGTPPMSRLVLPDHFFSRREAKAMGIDPKREVERILSEKPKVIVTQMNIGGDANKETLRPVTATITRSYRLAAVQSLYSEGSLSTCLVWVREP